MGYSGAGLSQSLLLKLFHLVLNVQWARKSMRMTLWSRHSPVRWESPSLPQTEKGLELGSPTFCVRALTTRLKITRPVVSPIQPMCVELGMLCTRLPDRVPQVRLVVEGQGLASPDVSIRLGSRHKIGVRAPAWGTVRMSQGRNVCA